MQAHLNVPCNFIAALFLKLWKRYAAKITSRWDLTTADSKEEDLRPQQLIYYVCSGKNGNEGESEMPMWQNCMVRMFSYSIVLLVIILALASALGIVVYRMSLLAMISVSDIQMTTTSAKYVVTISASLINWLFIRILNLVNFTIFSSLDANLIYIALYLLLVL